MEVLVFGRRNLASCRVICPDSKLVGSTDLDFPLCLNSDCCCSELLDKLSNDDASLTSVWLFRLNFLGGGIGAFGSEERDGGGELKRRDPPFEPFSFSVNSFSLSVFVDFLSGELVVEDELFRPNPNFCKVFLRRVSIMICENFSYEEIVSN